MCIRDRDITYIEGTVYRAKNLERVYEYQEIPSYGEVKRDKPTYAKAFMTQMHDKKNVLVQAQKMCIRDRYACGSRSDR